MDQYVLRGRLGGDGQPLQRGTADPFFADLFVGLGTRQNKTGAPCRSERLARYSQLLGVEEEMGPGAVHAMDNCRVRWKM